MYNCQQQSQQQNTQQQKTSLIAQHAATKSKTQILPPFSLLIARVCEDKITVCWWTQDRCFAPNIFQIMRTLCPKTCRFC
uniref:ShKT domain-containing protein n=1 Tax=Meloidogyne enterolobii TaxID=390850 RepID=A0A6V7UGT2_MELEN|nr:unnamed protein product [Meloidogyne enterolobii]